MYGGRIGGLAGKPYTSHTRPLHVPYTSPIHPFLRDTQALGEQVYFQVWGFFGVEDLPSKPPVRAFPEGWSPWAEFTGRVHWSCAPVQK